MRRGFHVVRLLALVLLPGLFATQVLAETVELAAVEQTPPAVLLNLPFMENLRDIPRDLQVMRAQKIPMLLFIHASYCGYCQWVDENFIQPMQNDPAYEGQLIVRRIEIDADSSILDRNGQNESNRHFADRMGVHLVPVVAFFGPDGKEIGDPINGVTVQDFYPYYFQQGIELAEACAKNPDPAKCTPSKKEDQRSL
ncbi:thioredoxin family protein [Halothiobacillus sp.]|uniref:thioredoxin family protein n=1 Tax=Halothiobacillus sp. TaxID=1891311 RepID=UPI00260D4FC5|nr:thioredoxin family protein [Halothiobacillus sp.]